MEEEIWKEIVGYEGKYWISNFGNVKSFHRGGAILRPFKTKTGYSFMGK